MCVLHMCAWCIQWSEKGAGSPGTGVMDDCELSCGYWGLNSRPLQEKHVFFTTETI